MINSADLRSNIDGGGYGQNIGYGISAENIAKMITDLMYNDEMENFSGFYGMANPPNFETWGHFSQMVWKGTTQVGCATVDCAALADVPGTPSAPFTVCNYGPPGRFLCSVAHSYF